jgi:uncharacterized protein (DUF2062 family)
MLLLTSTTYVNSSLALQGWYAAFATHHNITYNKIFNTFVLKGQGFAIFPVNLTWPWQGSQALQVLQEMFTHYHTPRFVGLLIAGILAAIAIFTTTTSVVVALPHSKNSAH